MSRPTAVATGSAFVEALDDATPRERAERLRELVAPGATWWVDTGRDRAAGVLGHDPGDARPWPLHGTMSMDAKLALVAQVGPTSFPQGLGRRVVTRAFGTESVAVVEAEGDALHASGKRYRNRYGFVFDVSDHGVTAVREYLDTLHAEDVFGGVRPSRPSTAPSPLPGRAFHASTEAERLALALWRALGRGEVELFGSLFEPGATWWTDSGTDRDRGSFDRSADRQPGTWPLHGVVPIETKLEAISARLAQGYGGSTLQVIPRRLVGDGHLVGVEADGYAELANGRVYQNRYLFVIDTGHDGIRQVREYCDTLHVVDATGAIEPTTREGGP